MNKIAVGQRGEGKTTLAAYDLFQHHAGNVAFDPRGMIEGYIVTDPEDLDDAIREGKWIDRETERPRFIVYRFDTTDLAAEFEVFCEVVFPPGFPFGGFGCLVDEAGRLQTANSIHPALARAMTQHPIKPPQESITIFQTMHTLGNSWAGGRSIIDELYMFRLTSPGDIKAIVEYTGHPELVEVVENLPPHCYVKYFNSRRPEGQPEYIIVEDSDSWHVPFTTTDEKGRKKSVDNAGRVASNDHVEGWMRSDG